MRFMEYIIGWLDEIADFFYDLYLECWDIPILESTIAPLFYYICEAFTYLSYWFEEFNEWLEDIDDRIKDILDKWDVFDLLEDWLEWAEDAWDWVRHAWSNVIDIIEDWWAVIRSHVEAWITIATEGLDELKVAWSNFWSDILPGIFNLLDTLQSKWAQFWAVTFPTLVSFQWLDEWWQGKLLDIELLFEGWTLTLAPFWEGWAEMRDQVVEFFADPWEWLYNRFDDFVERFW